MGYMSYMGYMGYMSYMSYMGYMGCRASGLCNHVTMQPCNYATM